MAIVWIVTHGELICGPDPLMSPEGIATIEELRAKMPLNISQFLVGTGRRFKQTLEILRRKRENVPVKYSAICGNAAALNADGDMVLADGTTFSRSDYIGLCDSYSFHPRIFIDNLPDNTVICGGAELMKTLYDHPKRGKLYKITDGSVMLVP